MTFIEDPLHAYRQGTDFQGFTLNTFRKMYRDMFSRGIKTIFYLLEALKIFRQLFLQRMQRDKVVSK